MVNPSFTGGGGGRGVEPNPQRFFFDNNKLETPNFAYSNFNNIHIRGYYQISDPPQNLSMSTCPKSPTKVEIKRKLQQFTVSGWLIINRGASDSEKRKL